MNHSCLLCLYACIYICKYLYDTWMYGRRRQPQSVWDRVVTASIQSYHRSAEIIDTCKFFKTYIGSGDLNLGLIVMWKSFYPLNHIPRQKILSHKYMSICHIFHITNVYVINVFTNVDVFIWELCITVIWRGIYFPLENTYQVHTLFFWTEMSSTGQCCPGYQQLSDGHSLELSGTGVSVE